VIYEIDGQAPSIDPSAWVAPNATVIGNVTLAERSSVWFGAVLRGDVEHIRIGRGSNVQDLAVLHVDPGYAMDIADDVTIGHKAMLHGCVVGEGSLIGINAVVLNGAKIGQNCLIAANALVPEGVEIPDGSVVMGSPGKVVKQLNDEQKRRLTHGTLHYVDNAARYRKGLREVRT